MATTGDQVRALPFAGANQTSFMFGAVLFAYLFFIVVKGDLAQWLGLLGLAGSAGSATASDSGTVSGTSSSAGIPSLQGLPAIPQIPGVSSIPLGGL